MSCKARIQLSSGSVITALEHPEQVILALPVTLAWILEHSERAGARVTTRTFIEPLIGVRWRLRWA